MYIVIDFNQNLQKSRSFLLELGRGVKIITQGKKHFDKLRY